MSIRVRPSVLVLYLFHICPVRVQLPLPLLISLPGEGCGGGNGPPRDRFPKRHRDVKRSIGVYYRRGKRGK